MRKCRDRNNRVPVHSPTTMASNKGVCTNMGTSTTEAAAPARVPAALYSALELVGPTKGLETMYTVAIAQ
ncbi:hypothetical protein ALO75_200152 [Pseudomonas syringae pv. coryli]|uniref:Asp/Glu/hydantoin racemase n=1 Tax=Pseudomonas syringae pv. coryli TaxID=317659 RepID=A0A0P9N4N5_9PSED|nr:hypothetical protein ALO75_200152 [Pseudomonas syringae pv. coryli]